MKLLKLLTVWPPFTPTRLVPTGVVWRVIGAGVRPRVIGSPIVGPALRRTS